MQAEMVTGFYDRLKEITSGYATFDYQEDGYERTQLERLTLLLNGKPADALAMLVHKSRAEAIGRQLVNRYISRRGA